MNNNLNNMSTRYPQRWKAPAVLALIAVSASLSTLDARADTAFGYKVSPLGQAELNMLEGLTLSNIGASGDDGVRIDLDPQGATIGAFVADWDWWDSDQSLPRGATLESRAYGTIDGVADQLIGTFFMTKIDDLRYEGSLEWSPVYPSAGQFVEIQQQGKTLGVFDAVREPMVMVMDPAQTGQTILQGWTPSESPGGFPIPSSMTWLCGILFECEYHAWTGVAELEIGSLASVPVDPESLVEIFTSPGQPNARIDTLSYVEYRFAQTPTFRFSNLRAFDVSTDSDDDGVVDVADNCSALANADQRDTDEDGIGNQCDADLDQNCYVGFADFIQMRQLFNSSDPDADLNGDGTVGIEDLRALRQQLFSAPGPSGLPNSCD